MLTKVLIAWGVVTTLLLMVLIGYLLGTRNLLPETRTAYSTYTDSTDPAATQGDVPVYTVPDMFLDIATEWRSELNQQERDGYAILFDPNRRELIVEQCEPIEYFKGGQPVGQLQPFCAAVLWGTVETISPTQAVVRGRTGNFITVDIELKDSQEELRLEFDAHVMHLIPGSKNELLQVFERLPETLRQKRLALRYESEQMEAALSKRNDQAFSAAEHVVMTPEEMAREEMRREKIRPQDDVSQNETVAAERVAAAAAHEAEKDDIPRYTLPTTESDMSTN